MPFPTRFQKSGGEGVQMRGHFGAREGDDARRRIPFQKLYLRAAKIAFADVRADFFVLFVSEFA